LKRKPPWLDDDATKVTKGEEQNPEGDDGEGVVIVELVVETDESCWETNQLSVVRVSPINDKPTLLIPLQIARVAFMLTSTPSQEAVAKQRVWHLHRNETSELSEISLVFSWKRRTEARKPFLKRIPPWGDEEAARQEEAEQEEEGSWATTTAPASITRANIIVKIIF
jgi:hypothetical protein